MNLLNNDVTTMMKNWKRKIMQQWVMVAITFWIAEPDLGN